MATSLKHQHLHPDRALEAAEGLVGLAKENSHPNFPVPLKQGLIWCLRGLKLGTSSLLRVTYSVTLALVRNFSFAFLLISPMDFALVF